MSINDYPTCSIKELIVEAIKNHIRDCGDTPKLITFSKAAEAAILKLNANEIGPHLSDKLFAEGISALGDRIFGLSFQTDFKATQDVVTS